MIRFCFYYNLDKTAHMSSRFKEEELVILHELKCNIPFLEFSTTYDKTFSVLKFVSEVCVGSYSLSCAKLEKYMNVLIYLYEDFTYVSNSITSVAHSMDIRRGRTFHTEKTLRKMLEICDLDRKYLVLFHITSNNYYAKRKNAIQFVLACEPNDDDLHHSLRKAYRKYIENMFTYDMIIEAF